MTKTLQTQLEPAVRLIVAEMMMQEALDAFRGKQYFRRQVKYHANQLSIQLKAETENIYGKLSDGSELGMNAVWELCHQMAGMIGRFRIGDLQRMLVLMDQLKEMPESGAGELLAVVAAFRAGEVYAVRDDQTINGAIAEGALERI